MKKFSRIMSALLAVLMMMGAVTVATSAAIPLLPDKEDASIDDYEDTIDVYLGETTGLNNPDNAKKQVKYETPQEKLAGMSDKPIWENHGYQLWIDEVTGEVATVKVSTGEILFSNPWDTQNASYANGSNKKSTSLAIKKQLLSQIVVNYVDNDTDKTMYSCIEAAARDQINVEYITDGIRVEYSIGREDTRMLVPKLIKAERFEQKILKPMREHFNEEPNVTVSDGRVKDENGKTILKNNDVWNLAEVGKTYKHYELVQMHNPSFKWDGELDLKYDNFEVKKVGAYYTRKDTSRAGSDREISEIEAAFPITKKMAVYVFDPTASTVEQMQVERRIKDYVPSFTYEELDAAHEETEYVGTDKPPALFKMALEYTLDENGMSVRLPANGIRFDQSLYQLNGIEMLPYMGAGSNDGDFNDGGDGYTFFPDGSGALFDFEQLNTGSNKTINGKVYGQDYAYHEISGTHQEIIRYPAFGIVEKWTGNKTVTDYDNVIKEATYDANGKLLTPAEYGTKKETVNEDHGFLAIIEEGDALAELSTFHMSATSIYNTVRMIFYPRPKDSYNMADALSVGSNTKMTVVSNRKYVGSYKVRYIMLSDDKLAAENKLSSYYEASWMGMAVAYRDYLEANNVLDRLTEADVDDDIPLYIETFGALWTTEKILSIPVDVMTPLTSFDNVKTMYAELSTAIEASMAEIVAGKDNVGSTEESAQDFSNLNFRLTGYANGGMYSTVPGNLNWEAAVGGASGFQDLINDSRKEGYDVFPDFDFVYINSTDTLDGVDLKTDAVKTIDNRYTGRREYSATMQTYLGYFGLAIAPSCFEKFVTKLAVNYLKYNPTGISVSTLGTDLNSDFDEEDPLNREDSKKYTIEALKQLTMLRTEDGESLKVMTDGGNAYSWRYVDYIVNMPLMSSRYNISSNAVPFIGVVLHGYLQFAGTPINEEGDIEFAFLKAIENGAGLYFTLSYQNTQELKEYTDLSKYFSVRYDIWKDDVVDMYVELNDLLCDLQTKLIIDHDFLVGDRVPDEAESEEDRENEQKAEDLKEAAETIEAIKQALKDALALRHTPTESVERIENALNNTNEQIKTLSKYIARLDSDYVVDCANNIRLIKRLESAVAEAKKTTFNAAAYAAAVEAVDTFINSNLIIKSVVESDKLAADATDAAKDAIADVEKQLVEKAIDVATVEAVKAVVANLDKVYTSTADENAAAKLDAEKLIAEVSSQVDALGKELVNTAAAGVKATVEKAVAAVKSGIISGLSSGIATESFVTGKTAYNKSVSDIEGKLNAAVDSNVSLDKLMAEAVAMGIAQSAVDKAVNLNKELYTITYKLSAITTFKSNFNRTLDSVRSAINAYYNAAKNIIDKADLKDSSGNAISSQLKSDVKNLVLWYQNEALYDAYAITDVGLTANDDYADMRQSSRTAADSAKKTVDDLPADRKAAAEAMWTKIEAELNAYKADAGDLYLAIIAEINSYYDKVEEICVAASRADIIEAVKLVNNNKRYSDISNIAKLFVSANGSFAADKAYAKAVEDYNASNAAVNLLDAATKKRANNTIDRCKDDVAKIDRAVYNELKLYIDTVASARELSLINATYVASISEYAAKAVQIADLETAKAAAQGALTTEEVALAKNAADLLFNEKKTAYEAKANGGKATAITALIDKVVEAQANYDVADAAYQIAKAIALPHDNATDAEIKAYSTTAEIKDYNRKLDARTAAYNELEAANQALNDAIAASPCKDELNALIDAYKAQLDAKEDLIKITAIAKAVEALANAEGIFVTDSATKTLLADAVAAARERTALNNKIAASNSYKASITAANSAFTSIESYLASAERDLNDAKTATEALRLRVESTKVDKEAADWTAKIYEIAVLIASYTPGELKTLSEKSEEGTIKDLYTKAYTVATTDIDTLKSNAEASADAKSDASLLYEVAKANAKHSREGLIELNDSYQMKKVTAEREMNNAQQFYDIAVNDTNDAQTKYNELKALYDSCKASYQELKVLETNVLLFGDETLESIKASTLSDMKIGNDLYDAVVAGIELVSNEWAKINAAAAEYKAAKEAYEALLAVDLSTLSDADKSENRTQRIYYSYKMMSAEKTINDGKNAIDTEHLTNFKDKYSQLTKLIETVFSREAQAKSHLSSTEALYNKVKDDASVSADIKNDAKVAYENAKALYDMIESNNDKFVADDGSESAFDKICKLACEELGLLTVKDEEAEKLEYAAPATVTKLADFVNELFGNVKAEAEEKEETKYTCNDGSIVAVTYGGKDGNDSAAYRTFLLNFNSFKVTVTYNGTEYEIDAYGYFVIDHN